MANLFEGNGVVYLLEFYYTSRNIFSVAIAGELKSCLYLHSLQEIVIDLIINEYARIIFAPLPLCFDE
jgi:hypothetical protein